MVLIFVGFSGNFGIEETTPVVDVMMWTGFRHKEHEGDASPHDCFPNQYMIQGLQKE